VTSAAPSAPKLNAISSLPFTDSLSPTAIPYHAVTPIPTAEGNYQYTTPSSYVKVSKNYYKNCIFIFKFIIFQVLRNFPKETYESGSTVSSLVTNNYPNAPASFSALPASPSGVPASYPTAIVSYPAVPVDHSHIPPDLPDALNTYEAAVRSHSAAPHSFSPFPEKPTIPAVYPNPDHGGTPAPSYHPEIIPVSHSTLPPLVLDNARDLFPTPTPVTHRGPGDFASEALYYLPQNVALHPPSPDMELSLPSYFLSEAKPLHPENVAAFYPHHPASTALPAIVLPEKAQAHVLPPPTPPANQLHPNKFAGALYLDSSVFHPSTPAPLSAVSTLPPFVPPLLQPSPSLHLNGTKTSFGFGHNIEHAEQSPPDSIQLVGPLPVRATGPASLTLLPTRQPAQLHTFALATNSVLHKREPEPLNVDTLIEGPEPSAADSSVLPSTDLNVPLVASPSSSQITTPINDLPMTTPKSSDVDSSKPLLQSLVVSSREPEQDVIVENNFQLQPKPLVFRQQMQASEQPNGGPSHSKQIIFSSAPPLVDYATKPPSLHFELVEDEIQPTSRETYWNSIEHRPLVNKLPEELFTKLENSWGKVREVSS
jgi:hypothetical protein